MLLCWGFMQVWNLKLSSSICLSDRFLLLQTKNNCKEHSTDCMCAHCSNFVIVWILCYLKSSHVQILSTFQLQHLQHKIDAVCNPCPIYVCLKPPRFQCQKPPGRIIQYWILVNNVPTNKERHVKVVNFCSPEPDRTYYWLTSLNFFYIGFKATAIGKPTFGATLITAAAIVVLLRLGTLS